MKRRNLLAVAGSAIVATTAGCMSSEDGDDPDPNTDGSTSPDTDGNDDGTTNDGTTDDGTTDEETNGGALAEPLSFEDPVRTGMQHTCFSEDRLSIDSEPDFTPGSTGFEFAGGMVVDDPENIYPTFVDLEQDTDNDVIRVVTGFTDEAPDDAEDVGTVGVPNGTTGAECVDNDDSALRVWFGYRVLVEDGGGKITEGVSLRWDVEFPDGSVEEVAAVDL